MPTNPQMPSFYSLPTYALSQFEYLYIGNLLDKLNLLWDFNTGWKKLPAAC